MKICKGLKKQDSLKEITELEKSHFQIGHKATAVRTLCYQHRDKCISQWARADMQRCVYGRCFLTQVPGQPSVGKNSLNRWCRDYWAIACKRMGLQRIFQNGS